MMPANQESLVQISTPVGAKKRRLTGSTFLKKERLSFIPQNLDFEVHNSILYTCHKVFTCTRSVCKLCRIDSCNSSDIIFTTVALH